MPMHWFAHSTQAAGVVGFSLAAIVCLLIGRSWRLAAIGCANAYFALELWNGWRFLLLVRLRDLFVRIAPYDDRWMLQVPLLLIALTAVALLLHRRSRAGIARPDGAAIGTCCGAALFLLELLSWHPVDHILYHMIGPLALIGWLWVMSALTVIISVVRQSRRWPSAHGAMVGHGA